MVEKLEERKTKFKMRRQWGIRIFGSRNKKKVEQMSERESGACMQLHVRDGMVSFGNLT